MKKKTKITIALSLLVIILSVWFWENSNQKHPILLGSYQSETMPPNIYMLSFDRKGRYEVYYNSELVDEGTFSGVNNTETYIIESSSENQLIVLLENDEFYYYAPDNQVFLLKNLDKVPTSLNRPEN